MHGRRKKSESELVITEEERQKAVAANDLLQEVLQMKSRAASHSQYDPQSTSEALDSTIRLLSLNPEIATAWNFRREVFDSIPSRPDLISALQKELAMSEKVLHKTLKSYCVWFHRKWCIGKLVELISQSDADQSLCLPSTTSPSASSPLPSSSAIDRLIARELSLCETLLLLYDARNFHCWHYRLFIESYLDSSTRKRLAAELSTKLIMDDFSNYSAWHLRMSADITDLDGELNMIKQALFTEPTDQSIWLYRKWFLKSRNLIDDATLDELLALEPDCVFALMEKAERGGEQARQLWERLARRDRIRKGYYEDKLSSCRPPIVQS